MARNTTVIIEEKRKRLKLYLDREEYMLSPDAVQSYGIGSRNIQRYNTDLEAIQKMIKQLEDEIQDLEAEESGSKPRKSVAVTPRDW